jgi:hypothetical protein
VTSQAGALTSNPAWPWHERLAWAGARHERLCGMSDWAGATNQTAFFDVFIATMAKLGRIEIKTAADGEIRRVCSEVN